MPKEMIEFASGATRSSDEEKLDYDGFFSPLVMQRYAQYLYKHRTQADGKLRASDNWQKGMGIPRYMKSKWRHFMDVWLHHRGWGLRANEKSIQDAICADLFNTMGYLHELLRAEYEVNKDEWIARGESDADCIS